MTREEALSKVKGYLTDYLSFDDYEEVEEIIKALEQEPRKGKWIKEKSIYGWDGRSYQCSVCGRSIHLDTVVEDLVDYPYCHCGAEMSEVEV